MWENVPVHQPFRVWSGKGRAEDWGSLDTSGGGSGGGLGSQQRLCKGVTLVRGGVCVCMPFPTHVCTRVGWADVGQPGVGKGCVCQAHATGCCRHPSVCPSHHTSACPSHQCMPTTPACAPHIRPAWAHHIISVCAHPNSTYPSHHTTCECPSHHPSTSLPSQRCVPITAVCAHHTSLYPSQQHVPISPVHAHHTTPVCPSHRISV